MDLVVLDGSDLGLAVDHDFVDPGVVGSDVVD